MVVNVKKAEEEQKYKNQSTENTPHFDRENEMNFGECGQLFLIYHLIAGCTNYHGIQDKSVTRCVYGAHKRKKTYTHLSHKQQRQDQPGKKIDDTIKKNSEKLPHSKAENRAHNTFVQWHLCVRGFLGCVKNGTDFIEKTVFNPRSTPTQRSLVCISAREMCVCLRAVCVSLPSN